MKSVEIKKCEQKIASLSKSIASKEQELSAKDEAIKSKKKECKEYFAFIKTSNDHRDKLRNELEAVNKNREKNRVEMSRIKAGLLYKTREEYEEMLKRLESELQNNNRPFNRLEESRLLANIQGHKQGMNQLDVYEQKKDAFDKLEKVHQEKKKELDEYWKAKTEVSQKLTTNQDELKRMKEEADQLRKEIEELKTQKIEAKKHHEDLIRENVLRQKEIKQASIEKGSTPRCKHAREDQVVIGMEEYIRDYTKLINYFQRLKNSEIESGACNKSSSNKSQPGTPNLSMSIPSQMNSLPRMSTSNSLNGYYPVGGSTSELNIGSLNRSFDSSSEQLTQKCTRPDSLDLNSLVLTNNTNSPSVVQSGGTFIYKKKFDEEPKTPKSRASGSMKKQKQTVAHSIEIINLLTKLDVPIYMSSQVDECIRELIVKRHNVQTELGIYRTAKMVQKKRTSSATTPDTVKPDMVDSDGSADTQINEIKSEIENDKQDSEMLGDKQSESKSVAEAELTAGAISLPTNDAQSVISSGRDSNYESDNNSLSSYGAMAIQFEGAMNQEGSYKSYKVSSDDSDATLNENDALVKRPKPPSLGQSHKHQNNDSSSSNSEKTVTPSTPKASSILNSAQLITKLKIASSPTTTGDETSPASSSISNTSIANFSATSSHQAPNPPPIGLSRQLSDGYGSSCTPLSASSINNEQSSQNLFFLNNKPNNSSSSPSTQQP